MHKQSIKALVIDEDERRFQEIQKLLSTSVDTGYEVDWESNPEQMEQVLTRHRYEIYLIEESIAMRDEWVTLKNATKGQFSPIMIFAENGNQQRDIMAMQAGAFGYSVLSEITATQLERAIRYSISHAKTVREERESEQRYYSLFQKSIDALVVVNRELDITETNPAMVEMMGMSPDALQQLNFMDLFLRPKDFEKFNSIITSKDQVKDFEAYLQNDSGKEYCCVMNFIGVYTNDGILTAYQGIIHDITKRKKAEKDLLDAEKLSMTGMIARSIAHEVRNPLTNIQLALEQLEDDVEEDAKLYVDIIRRNSGRIDFLISELLNSSKPKKLNPELKSLSTVINNTLDLVRDRIKLKKMKLLLDLENTQDKIYLDQELLNTALLNIFINAIEAMDSGQGELHVKTYSNEENIIVEISDNGKGIKKSDLKKLFDPFFTGKKNGMGLGLTTTKNIIKSHKGNIVVDSGQESGTTFKLIFNKQHGLSPLKQN